MGKELKAYVVWHKITGNASLCVTLSGQAQVVVSPRTQAHVRLHLEVEQCTTSNILESVTLTVLEHNATTTTQCVGDDELDGVGFALDGSHEVLVDYRVIMAQVVPKVKRVWTGRSLSLSE